MQYKKIQVFAILIGYVLYACACVINRMDSLAEKAIQLREKAKAHEKPSLAWWKPKYRKAADEYCRAAQFNYQVILRSS